MGSKISNTFPEYKLKTIHDFDLAPSRRPQVLVQTAGHVSGAVRFYQRQDVTNDTWDPSKKIFGVCIHPKYGGWFALRAVTIFTELECPNLEQKQPQDILAQDEIKELLIRYNDCWQDWSFRDVGSP